MTLRIRNYSIIIIVIALFYFLNHFENIRLYFHAVSPAGDTYESELQIKDDLKVINTGRYKIEYVERYSIDKNYLNDLLEEEKKVLEPYARAEGNDRLNISFSDADSVNGLNFSQKEVVIREAVNMLYFLTERKLKDSIKVVQFYYTPNYGFVMVGNESIIIPIDEFKRELEQNQGNSIEETLMRVTLYYYEKERQFEIDEE
jgi:hypothetical protein